ncbi:MAG: hypothetical protein JWQ11_4936 [Rhizobacter sp.]|nr:hypothetical protein [Rhizobacter sp.]
MHIENCWSSWGRAPHSTAGCKACIVGCQADVKRRLGAEIIKWLLQASRSSAGDGHATPDYYGHIIDWHCGRWWLALVAAVTFRSVPCVVWQFSLEKNARMTRCHALVSIQHLADFENNWTTSCRFMAMVSKHDQRWFRNMMDDSFET